MVDMNDLVEMKEFRQKKIVYCRRFRKISDKNLQKQYII